MTKKEAIIKMYEGEKMSHSSFLPEEYIIINEEGLIVTEDGYIHDQTSFWNYRKSEAFDNHWEYFINN